MYAYCLFAVYTRKTIDYLSQSDRYNAQLANWLPLPTADAVSAVGIHVHCPGLHTQPQPGVTTGVVRSVPHGTGHAKICFFAASRLTARESERLQEYQKMELDRSPRYILLLLNQFQTYVRVILTFSRKIIV